MWSRQGRLNASEDIYVYMFQDMTQMSMNAEQLMLTRAEWYVGFVKERRREELR